MEKDYLNNTSKWCLVDDTILNLKKWITDWTLILIDAEDEYRRLIKEEKHKEAMDFSWEMILSEIENDKKNQTSEDWKLTVFGPSIWNIRMKIAEELMMKVM